MGIENLSLHVLTPMYGGSCSSNYHESCVLLYQMCAEHGIKFTFTDLTNESLISRGRNRLADSYLKDTAQCTHCAFIDSDIGFMPPDLLHALELDLDVVGSPCSKKSFRWDRLNRALAKYPGRQFTDQEFRTACGDFVFTTEAFEGKKQFDIQQPLEVKQVGTGLMIVARRVFEGIIEKFPDEWYEGRGDANTLPGPIHDFFPVAVNKENREYESEDYWFCNRAREAGFKVWLAPWTRTTHKGSWDFEGNMPGLVQAGIEL